MKEDEMNNSSIERIFKRFADILGEQSKETNKKLEKLTDSITILTIAHTEAKKDREFDSARMTSIEEIQTTQAITLKSCSDLTIRLDERVNGNRAKWVMVGQIIAIIAAAVITGKLV